MESTVYHPDLEVRSLFSRAWETLKEHLWPTVAVFLIYALLTGGGSIWDRDGGLWQLILFAISGPITAGAYMFALRLMRGEAPDVGEVLNGFRVFGKAFGVFTLYTVAVVLGLVLLIVPGIFVAVALAPAMFLVLDDDLGVIDTLQKAWAMTDGHRASIFLVALAVIGINLLGLAVLIVGVIFTGALSLLVGAAMYDELDRAYAVNTTEAPA